MDFDAKIEDLETRHKALTETRIAWSKARLSDGRCHRCWDDNKERKVVKFEELGKEDGRPLCKKHYLERIDTLKSKLKRLLGEVKDEWKFYKKLKGLTRFAQIGEEVKEVRALLRESKHDTKWSDESLNKGKRLLVMLEAIKPKSSTFIDKGVLINKDLILAGTVGIGYSHQALIVITALDESERYKSHARVHLTIKEAERLMHLLRECIEHVRILRLIGQVEEKMLGKRRRY